MTRSNEHIRETLRLARELTALADEMDADAEDEGCMVLAGVVRDNAYGLRKQAEIERRAHQNGGTWKKPPSEKARTGSHLSVEDPPSRETDANGPADEP